MKMLLLECLLACAVLRTTAKYAVPFESIPMYDGDMFIYVNASVGSPAQKVKLVIRTDLYGNQASPALSSNMQCNNGSFDPSKSSTYVYNEKNGANGTDTFSLINGYTHTKLPLSVDDKACWPAASSLSLGYRSSFYSLIPDYAQKQPNQIAVLAFAQVGDNDSQITSGTLVIGDTASDLCSQDWQYLPLKTMKNGSVGWMLEIDRIKVGSFEKTISSEMRFFFDGYDFIVAKSVYPQVERVLGIQGDKVSCDSQTVIELGFKNSTWKFGPNTYMDRSTKDSSGMCTSTIDGDWGVFVFPFGFLKNNCIMYDYKNQRVGVAASKIAI